MTKKKEYPYTVEPNITKLGKDYYRILIKKGSGDNQRVFSEYVNGKITDARAVKRKGFAELEKKKEVEKDKSKVTLYEFCKIWLEFCKQDGLSPTTIKGYKQRLNDYILPTLGGYKLNEIKAYDIDKLLISLKNQKKKTLNENGKIEKLHSSTLNGAYRVLRNLLNKAVVWDYIEYNPIYKVKCPSPKPKKEKEICNKEELFALLKLIYNYNIKYSTLFFIAIFTGERRCEINGIHLEKTKDEDSNIDLDAKFTNEKGEIIKGGLIYVKHSVVWDNELKKIVERDIPKTEKGIRGVPIPMVCVESIKRYIKYREKEIKLLKNKYGDKIEIVPNLFLGKYGGLMHPDTLSHNWNKFKKRNKDELEKIIGKKNITLHGLRHSFCTYMRNDGKLSDKEMMDLMGHTDIKTTNDYTHNNREIGDKVIEMWDGLDL